MSSSRRAESLSADRTSARTRWISSSCLSALLILDERDRAGFLRSTMTGCLMSAGGGRVVQGDVKEEAREGVREGAGLDSIENMGREGLDDAPFSHS